MSEKIKPRKITKQDISDDVYTGADLEMILDEQFSKEERAVVEHLIELGDEQGYITIDDILALLPEAEEELVFLEVILQALQVADVTFIDDVDAGTDQVEAGAKGQKNGSQQKSKKMDNTIVDADTISAVDAGDTVGVYFSQVGGVPLLTREEEAELAKRIERGKEARDELAHGPVSPERRAELERLIEDGMAARTHLILANSRLVISVAKKHVGRGVPLLDLIQEGHIGLMRAVKKFDYTRGHKFSTYATWWIRQAITRAVADHGRTIRVPVHMGDQINKMLRARHRLTQEYGRDPTIEELAKVLDVMPSKVESMIKVARRPISLEKPIDEDEDAIIEDFIEDEETPAPEEMTIQDLMVDNVQRILETLPPREARVLRLRYGLPDKPVHTLKEVGEKMGITRERVRQIEAQALRRLRHPSMRRHLVDFVRE
jgi:RNA polymerase primary sigma factor